MLWLYVLLLRLCIASYPCLSVADWSEDEVAEYFLKHVGMEHLCGMFIRSHITGPVLLALREEHLVEMGCTRLGDRLLLMEYIQVWGGRQI